MACNGNWISNHAFRLFKDIFDFKNFCAPNFGRNFYKFFQKMWFFLQSSSIQSTLEIRKNNFREKMENFHENFSFQSLQPNLTHKMYFFLSWSRIK